jgi:hypothetical protein
VSQAEAAQTSWAASKQASALPIRALILPAKLDTSASTVSWLLTSTLLVAAVSVPITGRLGGCAVRRRGVGGRSRRRTARRCSRAL